MTTRWLKGVNLARIALAQVPANLQAGRLWECAGQEPFAAAEAYVRVLHSQLSVPFWGAHVQHGWMAPLAGLLFAWASEIHGHQSSADSNQPSTSLLSQQEASFLGEVCKDPHAGVVGLFALPLLSLSVGYQPDMKVLEEGAAFVEASMDALGPWEIVVLLWGSARTGLKPSSKFLSKAEASLKNIDELSVRESAAALWALCMLGAITEKTWETLLSHIAAHRSGDFDEASILHILQASMMYASKRKAGTPTGDLRATKMEVETLLSSLHWKVLRWCLDAYYEFIPSHPYLDGPYMTLSFMMQMLNRFRASCGSSDPKQNAYDKYMGSITKREVDWAEKTLQDARKLSQLKRELFYQWRGNEIVDEWQEVVNEAIFLLTRRLGNVVLQPPDCDIALPQKGVAIFIEDDRPRASVTNLAEASEGMLHLFGTETATPTSGFALHECHGTSLAKKRCIEERGWRVVVIPYSVWKNLDTPEAKQKVLQDAIVSGGFQDGMNSLFRSAVRR